MRIAIGGFMHESHSFAPEPTTYDDFRFPAGWAGLVSGPAVLEALRGKSMPIAGAITVAEQNQVALVPLTWCFGYPAGPVTDEAFERISALICAGLSTALDPGPEQRGPLNGLYLDLHGAGITPTYPDMEAELLRRVRHIVGPDLPLAVSLDPHANLTRAMVECVDVAVPYRTYPHVDMVDTGAHAMALLLARIKHGKPWARAFREIDFLLPIVTQCTVLSPMREVMDARTQIAATQGAVELAWCFGFPYADFPGCGPAIAAFAETQDAADAAGDAMAAHVRERERAFIPDVLTAEAAVARAMRLSAAVSRPIVIADAQDNPGGGGHGDTTGLLRELIAQGARGVAFGLINDAESAAACHAAGVGAMVNLSLGGKSDGVPLAVRANVLKLTNGRYISTGPMMKGNACDHGPTAMIEVAPGIRVIVVSKKTQAYDQALFTHIGITPLDEKILVLKSSVHFRADFQDIAEAVIIALAPGPVAVDSRVFPFQHLRPGMRLVPGGE